MSYTLCCKPAGTTIDQGRQLSHAIFGQQILLNFKHFMFPILEAGTDIYSMNFVYYIKKGTHYKELVASKGTVLWSFFSWVADYCFMPIYSGYYTYKRSVISLSLPPQHINCNCSTQDKVVAINFIYTLF